jgi:hypothetical protein
LLKRDLKEHEEKLKTLSYDPESLCAPSVLHLTRLPAGLLQVDLAENLVVSTGENPTGRSLSDQDLSILETLVLRQLEHVSVLDSLNSLTFNTVFESSGEDNDFCPDVEPEEVRAIFTKISAVSTHLSRLAARLYTDVILARRDLALSAFPSGMPALAASLRTAPFSCVGLLGQHSEEPSQLHQSFLTDCLWQYPVNSYTTESTCWYTKKPVDMHILANWRTFLMVTHNSYQRMTS